MGFLMKKNLSICCSFENRVAIFTCIILNRAYFDKFNSLLLRISVNLLYNRVYEQTSLGLIFPLILFPILPKLRLFRAINRDIEKLVSVFCVCGGERGEQICHNVCVK